MVEVTQLDKKTFDFVSILTGVVMLVYMATGVYALVTKMITWEVFAGAFGSPATMLLGYWVRGTQQ